MADADASLAGAKRKQRSSSAHGDALSSDADPVPLLTPSKRFSTGAAGRAKSPLAGKSPLVSGDPSSPTSPLVVPRSPSDNSRLWAARIAATQRIARRKGSLSGAGGGGAGGSRASSAMAAKRRALSLSPAAASFEASVSITTKMLPKRPKIKVEPVVATPVKTPAKGRRRSSTPGPVIDLVEEGDEDVEMAEEKSAVKTEVGKHEQEENKEKVENEERAEEDELVDNGVDLDESVATEDTEEQNTHVETDDVEEEQNLPPVSKEVESSPPVDSEEKPQETHPRIKNEPVECTVKTERHVFVKVETAVTSGARPPLAPATSRRRTLFEGAEAEREAEAAAEAHSEANEEVEGEDGKETGDLNEQLAKLAATLAAEQAEKAALKQQLDEMAAKLRESEERQQQLESQLASLSIGAVSIKQERA